MSKFIKLSTKEDGKDVVYEGRFLGFIKDDEFNALVQKTSDVATRLESKATQPLFDVITKFDNMKGYRLIMTMKKKDTETVLKKTLYVTESLDLVVEVSSAALEKKKVTFQSEDHETIEVREID